MSRELIFRQFQINADGSKIEIFHDINKQESYFIRECVLVEGESKPRNDERINMKFFLHKAGEYRNKNSHSANCPVDTLLFTITPLEQFTRLRDCNGKMIFENDVVKVSFERDCIGEQESVRGTGIVNYACGGFLIMDVDKEEAILIFDIPDTKYNAEVIGNVHEGVHSEADTK